MSAYGEGRRAVELYLGHVEARVGGYGAGELSHFLHVHALREYAAERWPELVPRCAEILARPVWAETASGALAAAEDGDGFNRALRVCEELGIPTAEALRGRLRAEPYDPVYWQVLIRQATPQDVDEFLALAEELLPLAEIASGPGLEDGFGPRFRAHRALDIILQDLAGWPGHGWPLIAAGLDCPVIRNRNMAIRALAAWDHATLPAEVRAAVAAALRAEPDAAVRERLSRLHEGRPQE